MQQRQEEEEKGNLHGNNNIATIKLSEKRQRQTKNIFLFFSSLLFG